MTSRSGLGSQKLKYFVSSDFKDRIYLTSRLNPKTCMTYPKSGILGYLALLGQIKQHILILFSTAMLKNQNKIGHLLDLPSIG